MAPGAALRARRDMAMNTQTQVRKWLQGWAPVAAGTCVARVLGAEMTGDPAMLASGCEEDIEVMPVKNRVSLIIINQIV